LTLLLVKVPCDKSPGPVMESFYIAGLETVYHPPFQREPLLLGSIHPPPPPPKKSRFLSVPQKFVCFKTPKFCFSLPNSDTISVLFLPQFFTGYQRLLVLSLAPWEISFVPQSFGKSPCFLTVFFSLPCPRRPRCYFSHPVCYALSHDDTYTCLSTQPTFSPSAFGPGPTLSTTV